MRTLSKEELQEVLERHKKWLLYEAGGERANLNGANLSMADLRYANFRYAILTGAILTGANLSKANLGMADLSKANLSMADLRWADLRRANLNGADLSKADLNGADLRWVDLNGATVDYPIACPESGSFIAYKKAGGYIVKLQILENAKRSSATSRKCRCDKAKVVAIENTDGTVATINSIRSNYDINFVYRVGEVVSVDDFDDNRWIECTTGIHFFITRAEAVGYNM